MILSDKSIRKAIEEGQIIIEGLDPKNIQPCSVDLTLAPELKMYTRQIAMFTYDEGLERKGNMPEGAVMTKRVRSIDASGKAMQYEETWEVPLDPRKDNPTHSFIMDDAGFVLYPGEVYLYAVNERIGVKGNIRAKCEGKSSLGRLGLFVHVTAGFIDPGFEGSLVLELVATRPIRVYPGMKICQLEFARVEEVETSYDKKEGAKYNQQEGVQASLYHKNYE